MSEEGGKVSGSGGTKPKRGENKERKEKRKKKDSHAYKFCQMCTKVEKKNRTAKRMGATFVGV